MKHFVRFCFYSVLFIGVLLQVGGLNSVVSAADSRKHILFVGDSITAGLGVELEQAYPALILKMLKGNGIQGIRITNSSISGSTSAGALSRLKWFLSTGQVPNLLVLALGANDGLRGLSTREMSQNLDKTIALAKGKSIQVILAGMEIPPNYGPEYSKSFKKVFAFLSDKHQIPLIPFLLKGVAGRPSLNQTDGIHPNREGHKVIARTMLPYILENL